MRVADCCNKDVVVADHGANIQELARIMREFHVGDLVVVEPVDGGARPVGIVTDRDLVVEVLAQDVPVDEVTVDDVMSPNVATAREDDDVLDTLNRMRELGVRRMPVVDARGMLTGIITVDDLLELVAESINNVVGLVVREIGTEGVRRQ
jgi:predicted transcriptional regulator